MEGREVRYHLGGGAWLLGMAALGAWLAVMALDSQTPYDYIAEGATISPDPAPPGAIVTLRWPIRVRRLCPGSVQRMLKDSTGKDFAYDPTPSSLTVKMGDTEINKVIALPPGLAPGEVVYNATVSFQCNRLQAFFPLIVQTPTLRFNVKEGSR